MSFGKSGRILRDQRHGRLLVKARAGDSEAFRQLYEELYRPVAGYIAVRLENPEDTEDLIAWVFHRFLERLVDYDSRRGGVLGWILSIARNALIDHYRACRQMIPVEDLAEILAGPELDPLERMIQDERSRLVAGLLRECSASTREMFALRFGQGLRYRQIAAVLDLSEDAVKQRISRTLRDLKSRLVSRAQRGGEVDYAV
jgi:RNA polymerase sigma-70 factor (ECF subfamily)